MLILFAYLRFAWTYKYKVTINDLPGGEPPQKQARNAMKASAESTSTTSGGGDS
jgi:hypothetical protein